MSAQCFDLLMFNFKAERTCLTMNTFHMASYLIAILCGWVVVVSAQSSIEVSVDLGEGLVYFLVIFFFGLTFCTPIVRWLYVNYLSIWVEKAGKEVNKASKRFTERMSDASRRVTQSIRVEK